MPTRPDQHQVQLGSRTIPFCLRRADRLRLRIVVHPDLSVTVTAPRRLSAEEVSAAVLRKAGWIIRQMDRLAEYHPLPTPRRYESGETLLYLGRQYRLRVRAGPASSIKLVGRFLEAEFSDPGDREAVAGLVDGWFRRRAVDVLQQAEHRCLGITSRHGVDAAVVVLRRMKRRWGSCSAKGRITLNPALVCVPVHCVDYVIMHELCHLKHHDHSRTFHRLLTRCMPDWESRKACLDRWAVQ